MENKLKYYLLGKDSMIGKVYEDKDLGRLTILFGGVKIEDCEEIRIYDREKNCDVSDMSIIGFLLSSLADF